MAQLNLGTELQLGSSTTPVTFTDIPGLRTIPGIEQSQDKIEVTSHSSYSSGVAFRQYIPSGLIDPGDYEFDMQTDLTDTVHQEIFSIFKSKEERKWRLIYPDGLAYEFSAYVSGITRAEADAQSPDAIIDTVALSISGEVEDISDELLSPEEP